MRYVLNNPTSWAFDMSYILYGGAVHHGRRLRAVAQRPRARRRASSGCCGRGSRRAIELVLYFIFFYPGVTALIIAGYGYAHDSFGYREVSVNSPVGVPIWQLKALIPLAGIMLFIQGIAQVIRCILCIRDRRTGRSSCTTSRSSRACSSTSTSSATAAEGAPMSNPELALVMLGSFIFIILLGFPIAFTLMAMGVMFGYYAYYTPGPGLLRQPGVLPALAEHLQHHEQRRADGRPAVPVHGLHDREIEHPRPAVLQPAGRAARDPRARWRWRR